MARDGGETLVPVGCPVGLRPGQFRGRDAGGVHAEERFTCTTREWCVLIHHLFRTTAGTSVSPTIPGHDVSGVVEALGPGVSDVSPGDSVYGLIAFPRDGSAAEYVTVRAGDLAPGPRTLDHVHAAAVPLSALTAWQALLTHAGLAAGQRVLIHGAASGASARSPPSSPAGGEPT